MGCTLAAREEANTYAQVTLCFQAVPNESTLHTIRCLPLNNLLISIFDFQVGPTVLFLSIPQTAS